MQSPHHSTCTYKLKIYVELSKIIIIRKSYTKQRYPIERAPNYNNNVGLWVEMEIFFL